MRIKNAGLEGTRHVNFVPPKFNNYFAKKYKTQWKIYKNIHPELLSDAYFFVTNHYIFNFILANFERRGIGRYIKTTINFMQHNSIHK